MSIFKLGNLLRLLCVPVLLVQSTLAMALEPPVNLTASVISPTQVHWTWDWATDAIQYEVSIDGLVLALTPNTWFTSSGLWPGEHSLSVKTVDQAEQYSLPSVEIRTDTTSINHRLRVVLETANVVSANVGPIDPESFNYAGVNNKPGYELAFSDEFNGSTLHAAKWNTQLRWDGEHNGDRYEYRIINGEAQFYVNIYSEDQEHIDNVVANYNPFEFDGSRLAIRAQRNPFKNRDNNADHGPLNSMLSQQEFLSGAISTYDKFTQKHGYFEARIKIPSHVGAFPAFWLHHQRRENENTRKSEIDIMENLGHAPQYIYNSFHSFNNVSEGVSGEIQSLKPLPEGQIHNGTDFSLDYHTYAVEWSPGYIIWYIDNQKVSELSDINVDHEELYLILNLAMGGNWTNFPVSSGGLGRDANNFYPNWEDLDSFSNPALEIDYVRVYKRK